MVPLVEKEQSSTPEDSSVWREARWKTNTGENKITSNWGRDGDYKEEGDK